MRVPDEAKIVQRLDSFVVQIRMGTLLEQLVLVALAFHPLSETALGPVDVWYVAMTVPLIVLNQILIAFIPSLVLVGMDLG